LSVTCVARLSLLRRVAIVCINVCVAETDEVAHLRELRAQLEQENRTLRDAMVLLPDGVVMACYSGIM
jgi:hypothetical protein